MPLIDEPVDDDRAARVPVALRRIGDPGLPRRAPAARVEREHRRVLRGDEDPVAPDREIAELVEPARQVALQRTPVLPDQRAGVGLQRLDDVARVGQVHHAPVDERRRLVHAVRHRPRPGEAQVADVLRVHPVERAVPLAVVGAPEHQPVARGRIEQHVVRDRFEVLDLALAGRPDVLLLRRRGRRAATARGAAATRSSGSFGSAAAPGVPHPRLVAPRRRARQRPRPRPGQRRAQARRVGRQRFLAGRGAVRQQHEGGEVRTSARAGASSGSPAAW